MSGTTAPSVIAVRTAFSASSGCTSSAGRRLLPDPLQGGQNLDDRRAPLVERFLKDLFPLIERLATAPARHAMLRLDIAHARRRCR